MSHWDKFVASTTPEGKMFNEPFLPKSNNKLKNTKSSRKLGSPFDPKHDNSISALFVKEINKEERNA